MEETSQRLQAVGHKLALRPLRQHNLGPTWYAPERLEREWKGESWGALCASEAGLRSDGAAGGFGAQLPPQARSALREALYAMHAHPPGSWAPAPPRYPSRCRCKSTRRTRGRRYGDVESVLRLARASLPILRYLVNEEFPQLPGGGVQVVSASRWCSGGCQLQARLGRLLRCVVCVLLDASHLLAAPDALHAPTCACPPARVAPSIHRRLAGRCGAPAPRRCTPPSWPPATCWPTGRPRARWTSTVGAP